MQIQKIVQFHSTSFLILKLLHDSLIINTTSWKARVRIRVWVRVWCDDLAIFEKVGCGCSGIRLLINY